MSGSTTSPSSRGSATLSGGESQRIRLASQIGSGLTGVLYVLDEPSIGLHQRDNERLLGTLRRLKTLGNTVLVVEHDEDAIRAADHLIDMGPAAGVNGGHVIATGTAGRARGQPEIAHRRLSLRPQAHRGAGDAPSRGPEARWSRVVNARGNNLKRVNGALPARHVLLRHRRLGRRQVDARGGHALPRRLAPADGLGRGAGGA